MIKDLEEKQLQLAYFLSRGNKNVEEKFSEFNICKVWLGWWKNDNAQSVARETKEKILGLYKNADKETTKKLMKENGRKNSNKIRNKLLYLRHRHFEELTKMMKEMGLTDRYYIADKTAYGGSVTRLGRYAIYKDGQSPKEKSQYFGSYDDMRIIIEKLAEE